MQILGSKVDLDKKCRIVVEYNPAGRTVIRGHKEL